MKSFFCADYLFCLIFLLVAFIGTSQAELEQTKNRRGGGGNSGLFLFPRVGRSDPSLANMNLHDADAASLFDGFYEASGEEFEGAPKGDFKRANLKLYPRVGRTDAELRKWAHLMALQQAMDRRAGPSSSSGGLWFGPRLGKRSVQTHEPKVAHQNGQKENY